MLFSKGGKGVLNPRYLKENAPPFLLNFSGYKRSRKLNNILKLKGLSTILVADDISYAYLVLASVYCP